MNPLLLWQVYSERKTIFYVALTFCFILLLPFAAVLTITNTGIQLVSDQLAVGNSSNESVTLKNPLNGQETITIPGPFTWPTEGYITLEFGESSLYQPFHTGLDIAGKRGDPIQAFMKGKVIYAGEISWGYGKHVILGHGNNITSIYAHLDSVWVKVNDEVSQGQVIGTEGSTGWSTGPHLHFETRVYGIPVNPRIFIGK